VATIAKFYLLDAATPNTGTMPSGSILSSGGLAPANASGATTARDATDVAGTSNPDIEAVVTATADTNQQTWGMRRFVSRPLAAHTFAAADGNWTWSFAWLESNTSHTGGAGGGSIHCITYAWDPGAGARVGSVAQWAHLFVSTTGASTSETAYSNTAAWSTSLTISDGNILVFDVYTTFQQGMATAYNENFAYNGTTEASTTTCASFVTPPAALTLFTAAAAASPHGALVAPSVAVTSGYQIGRTS
jgi:Neuraminidase (sialidase)